MPKCPICGRPMKQELTGGANSVVYTCTQLNCWEDSSRQPKRPVVKKGNPGAKGSNNDG